MRTWKHCTCVIIFVIATFIVVLTACNHLTPMGNEPFPREFNDLIFLGKNITLIDNTNGTTDLKARGIWQQIHDGLDTSLFLPSINFWNKFIAIHNTGQFAIVVNSGMDYEFGHDVEGYKVLFKENQLSGYDSDTILGIILQAINIEMTVPN